MGSAENCMKLRQTWRWNIGTREIQIDEINQEYESQRSQLQQANQWADQAQREAISLCGELNGIEECNFPRTMQDVVTNWRIEKKLLRRNSQTRIEQLAMRQLRNPTMAQIRDYSSSDARGISEELWSDPRSRSNLHFSQSQNLAGAAILDCREIHWMALVLQETSTIQRIRHHPLRAWDLVLPRQHGERVEWEENRWIRRFNHLTSKVEVACWLKPLSVEPFCCRVCSCMSCAWLFVVGDCGIFSCVCGDVFCPILVFADAEPFWLWNDDPVFQNQSRRRKPSNLVTTGFAAQDSGKLRCKSHNHIVKRMAVATNEDDWGHIVKRMAVATNEDDWGHIVKRMAVATNEDDWGHIVKRMALATNEDDWGGLMTVKTQSMQARLQGVRRTILWGNKIGNSSHGLNLKGVERNNIRTMSCCSKWRYYVRLCKSWASRCQMDKALVNKCKKVSRLKWKSQKAGRLEEYGTSKMEESFPKRTTGQTAGPKWDQADGEKGSGCIERRDERPSDGKRKHSLQRGKLGPGGSGTFAGPPAFASRFNEMFTPKKWNLKDGHGQQKV